MIQQYMKGKTIEEIKYILKSSTITTDVQMDELTEKCIEYELFEYLPRNEKGICIYHIDLYVSYSNIKKLPDNLTILGSLYCTVNNINNLPKNLIVHRDLDCSFNNLSALPDDLIVYGYLDCSDQDTKIRLELPPTATVKGRFFN